MKKKLVAFAETNNEDRYSHLEILDSESFNTIYNSNFIIQILIL